MDIRMITLSQTDRRDQLVDTAIESYMDWREQSRAVVEAYESWINAPSSQRRLAFAAYQATLDQEELAASHYASAIKAVQLRLKPERGAAS
jgi:hypothetical protein